MCTVSLLILKWSWQHLNEALSSIGHIAQGKPAWPRAGTLAELSGRRDSPFAEVAKLLKTPQWLPLQLRVTILLHLNLAYFSGFTFSSRPLCSLRSCHTGLPAVLPPQGLCTCCSLCLECSSPHGSLPLFLENSVLASHQREAHALPGNMAVSAWLPPTPFSALLLC